jgi:hypothetical protein
MDADHQGGGRLRGLGYSRFQRRSALSRTAAFGRLF